MAFVLVAVFSSANTPTRAQENATPPYFLVATPDLIDPIFQKSVILILPAHRSPLIVGLIVNRPTRFRLGELLREVPALKSRTEAPYFGGPVAMNSPALIFRSSQSGRGAVKLFDGVYAKLDSEPDDDVLKQPPAAANLRIYLGRAQWDANQLRGEMLRGSWYVVPADSATVFSPNPAQLWQTLVTRAQMQKADAADTASHGLWRD